MRIEGEITAVETNGDSLYVKVQGKAVRAAGWLALEMQTFHVPVTTRNSRAFYVGREISVEITFR